jgi:hypothetical protein
MPLPKRRTQGDGGGGRRLPIDFAALIEPVARRLWRESNEQLSKNGQIRFGTRGSRCIEPKKGRWFDHETKEGGNVIELIKRETGREDVVDWLVEEHLIPAQAAGQRKHIAATYDYVDENGAVLFQVVRFDDPKDFRQRRPNGKGAGGTGASRAYGALCIACRRCSRR